MGEGQVVNITINVTDGNATEAVQQVVGQLQAIGPAGEVAGAQAAAGLDKVGEHALSAKENVRLLNDDLGLRIPRAMQAVINQSQLMSAAIGMIGPGLIAMGAVDILSHMGEMVYHLYEKWFDVDAITAEYVKKLDEAAQKEFLNPMNVEAALSHLQQINAQLDMLNDKKSQSSATWGGLLAPGERYTPDDEKKRVALLAQQSELDANAAKYSNASLDDGIAQMEKFVNATEKGYQQISDLKSLADQKTTNAFDRGEFGNLLENYAAAYDKYKDALVDNETEATGKIIALKRGEMDQVIQMQNAAVNAGKEGNALRTAQELEEIDAITRKFNEGEISKETASAETAAKRREFAAQELKLQEQLDSETRHFADEAAQAGLKGTALIEAQLHTKMKDIDESEDKAVGPNGVETSDQKIQFQSQRDSARKIANQKELEEQTQFNEKIKQLMDASDDYQLQGYARIEAATQKHLNELWMADSAYYKDQSEAANAFNAQALHVEENAERERQVLHQRTMDQIVKEEEQAARLSLPEWQQSMLAIEDSYDDRIRKIKEDVQQRVMSETEGARAVTAAWNIEGVQMEKASEETRNKVASGLQSLFSNPEQFFEKRAMDSAFELIANEMMGVFKKNSPAGGMLNYIFGMGPEMSTDSNPLHAMGSALGMGGHHGAGVPDIAGASTSTNPSMMSFQQGSTSLVAGSNALLTGSNALMTAASALQSSGAGGGMSNGLAGMSSGGSLTNTGSGALTPTGTGMAGATQNLGMASSGLGDLSTFGGLGAGSVLGTAATGMAGSSADAGMGVGSVAGSLLATDSTASTPGISGMSATMGMAGGALMGGMSMMSAYKNSDPTAGLMGGAMGGMEAGSALGSIVPGLGTVVGGAVGAIAGGIGGLLAGIFGDKGRGQAVALDVNTIQPALLADMQDFDAGRSGYSTMSSQLNQMLISAQSSTNQWGSGARNYFQSNIQPEIQASLLSLQKQEIGGRGAVTMSAAQYHSGGLIGDFGDLQTSENEGFIHAMQGEIMMNPAAAAAHAPILQAMNSGTNFGYSSTVLPRMPANSGSGANVNVTVQAIDSKSVATWANGGGGRALVAALNQAQRQYSGVGRG